MGHTEPVIANLLAVTPAITIIVQLEPVSPDTGSGFSHY